MTTDQRSDRRGVLVLCGREACHRPAHPAAWNRVTHWTYCLDCAQEIESCRDASIEPLYPILNDLRSAGRTIASFRQRSQRDLYGPGMWHRHCKGGK